jgi:hypothetical protein
MDLLNTEIAQMILSQGIFAVLFVWLLISERKGSQTREEKLMVQLEKNSAVYENVIQAVNSLKDLIMKQK